MYRWNNYPHNNSTTSTRSAARVLHLSQTTVWEILHDTFKIWSPCSSLTKHFRPNRYWAKCLFQRSQSHVKVCWREYRIHISCMGSSFPIVHAIYSLVFRTFATSMQWLMTAWSLVYNNKNTSLKPKVSVISINRLHGICIFTFSLKKTVTMKHDNIFFLDKFICF